MSTLLDKVFNLSQDKNEDAITAKLLLLYYLLLFEEKRRETFQTVKHSAKAMKLEINFNNNRSAWGIRQIFFFKQMK